jgi:replication factor C large subunit
MEGIICGTGVLEKIAENTGGDLRSAIKDLQATATDKKEIEVVDVTTAERDTKESIFKVLTKVFKGMDPVEAYRATFSLDETPEDLIQWVDENLPNQYLDKDETLSEDLTAAYHNLSRADTYLGRVRLRQNYGLWRYAGFLLSGGTAMAKKHPHSGFRKLQPPSMWRRMGQLRSKRNMRDNIAAKVGLHCNEPIRDCRIDLLRMYGLLLKNEDYAVDAAYSLELDVDEIAYLTESKRVTKKIQKIYDASREMMHEKEDEDIDIFMHAPEKDRGQSTLDSMFSAEKDPAEENQMGGKEKDNPKPAKSQKTLFDF